MNRCTVNLIDVIDSLLPLQIYGNIDIGITGVAFDSRKVQAGDIFIAIAGLKQDGNAFQSHALDSGAVAIIAETKPQIDTAPYIRVKDARRALAVLASAYSGHPDRALRLTGITGTNGKTTTAYLTRSILKAAGHSTGLISTIEYISGEQSIQAERTTPDALEINKLLAKMVETGSTHTVMEVTSHGLQQKRTFGLDFDRVVFSNLARDHLDYHGSHEHYLQAKLQLFKGLKNSAIAIVNADDPVGQIIQKQTNARTWSYGVRSGSTQFTGKVVEMERSNMSVEMHLQGEKLRLTTPFLGKHNLYNLLAAAAVGISYGIELETIRSGLESLKSIPGRMEFIKSKQPFDVIIDFAHTPEALKRILLTVRSFCTGRVILVFGCGGERDSGKRPQMGRIAEQFADHIILTSDNPRSEDPEKILHDIDAGIMDKSRRKVAPERKLALVEALQKARPGDVVLITGKGHEIYQEIAGEKRSFEDRVAVEEYLCGLS